MSAPNVELIAASLRSCCSLGGVGGGGGGEHHSPVRRPPPLARDFVEGSEEIAWGITVEMNSAIALPFHWEQCLDMRTGEIYYINWEIGVRTSEDPRPTSGSDDYYYYYDDDDLDSDEYSYPRISSGDNFDEGIDEDSTDTAVSSSLASASSSQSSSAVEETGDNFSQLILVAAGCRACFMYFMVPKPVDVCPNCGAGLLHLGRDGLA